MHPELARSTVPREPGRSRAAMPAVMRRQADGRAPGQGAATAGVALVPRSADRGPPRRPPPREPGPPYPTPTPLRAAALTIRRTRPNAGRPSP